MVLEPSDWNLAYCYQVFHRTLPAGATIVWSADFRGLETVATHSPAGVAEAGWVTVAQGLSNTTHTVEFTGVSGGSILARSFRPPLSAK